MASRFREFTAVSSVSDENANARVQIKNQNAVKPLTTRRVALNELSKNVNTLKSTTTGAAPKRVVEPTKFHKDEKKTTRPLIKQSSLATTHNTGTVKLTGFKSKSIDIVGTENKIKDLVLKKNDVDEVKEVVPVRRDQETENVLPENVEDVDANSRNDPELVTEYVMDICRYLRELEVKYQVKADFMNGHKSTPKMRTVLVNWLAQITYTFKFCLETLHIGVSILDRYLQEHKMVGRETLQLVGITALLIACKIEEVYAPAIDDFAYVTDNAFTKRHILKMEREMLKSLDFNLGKPVSLQFLRRYSKVGKVESEQHTLGKYLLELALLDHTFSHVKPSLLAAAACCLSLAILKEVNAPSTVWTPTMEYYSTYKYSDFKHLVIELAHLLVKSENSKFQTIRSKYSAANCHKISSNSKLRGPLVKKLTSITSTFRTPSSTQQ